MKDQLPTVRRKLLSVSEVAEWLGVSTAWVRDHAQGRRQPKLIAVKLGVESGKGHWKFLESDVVQFIEDRRQKHIGVRIPGGSLFGGSAPLPKGSGSGCSAAYFESAISPRRSEQTQESSFPF